MRPIFQLLFLVSVLGVELSAQSDLFEWSLYRVLDAKQSVTAIAFSADGATGAFATTGGNVVLIDLTTAESATRTVKKYDRTKVVALAFAGDNTALISASEGGEISVVRLSGGAASSIATRGKLITAAVSKDGTLLATATADGRLTLWDLPFRRELGELPHASKKPFFEVGFAANDDTVVAVSQSASIAMWDAKTRAPLRRQQDADQSIHAASIGGGSKFLAISSESADLQGGLRQVAVGPRDMVRENRLKFYDLGQGTVAKTLDVVKADVPALALSPNGRYLAALRSEPKRSVVAIYDTLRGIEVASANMRSNGTAAAFSADGEWLGVGSDHGEITIWKVKGTAGEIGPSDLRGTKFTITTKNHEPLIAPAEPTVLAVADFAVNGTDVSNGRATAEMVRARIGDGQNVRVVERAQVEKIFREQNLQMSDRIDMHTAVKLGQMLGAAKMILGSVGQLGSTITIDVRSVDVVTGVIDGEREVLCQQCGPSDLPEAVTVLKSVLVK